MPSLPDRRSGKERRDWEAVLERLSRGERTAFVELARLITGFLASWQAYGFRDEWDDLIQEVILAAVQAHRNRKLRSPEAAIGYLRSTARFKFVDWLRRRRTESLPEEGEEAATLHWPPEHAPPEGGFQIWDRVRRLPPGQQKAVVLVYVQDMTYDEAAAASGIPLGSLKRYLRQGLAALRESLVDFVEVGGPIPGVGPTAPEESTPDEARGGTGGAR